VESEDLTPAGFSRNDEAELSELPLSAFIIQPFVGAVFEARVSLSRKRRQESAKSKD
jgi:hypothetical protein